MRRSDGRKRRSSSRGSEQERTSEVSPDNTASSRVIRTRSRSKDESPNKLINNKLNGSSKDENIVKNVFSSPRGRGRGKGRGRSISPRMVTMNSSHHTRSFSSKVNKSPETKVSQLDKDTGDQSGNTIHDIKTEPPNDTSQGGDSNEISNLDDSIDNLTDTVDVQSEDVIVEARESGVTCPDISKLGDTESVGIQLRDKTLETSHSETEVSSCNSTKHEDLSTDQDTPKRRMSHYVGSHNSESDNGKESTTQQKATDPIVEVQTVTLTQSPRTRSLSAKQREQCGEVSTSTNQVEPLAREIPLKTETNLSPSKCSPRRGRGRPPNMATVNAKVNLKQKLQNMEAETKDSSKVDNDKVNKDSIVPSSCTDTKLQASLKGGDINVSNNTAGDDSEEATKTDCQSAANVVSCDHDYFAVSRQGQDVTMDTEEEEDSDVEVMELDSESSGADTPKKNCTQGNYTKDLENIDCKLSDNSADVKESPVFLSPADKEYLTKTEIQLPSQQSQLPSQQSQLPSQQSQLPSQQSQLPSQQSQTLAQNTKIPGADALAVVKASLGNKPMTDIEAIDNKKSSSVALQPTKIVSPRGRGRKKGYSPKKSPKSATSTTVTSATIVQTVNKNQGILTNVKINATNLLQGDVSKSDSCVTTEEPSMSQESIDQKNKIQELKRKYCEVEDVDSDLHANKLYDASDIDDPFYFESDSAALKGNKDYRLLLRTLVTLEGQRIQAVQDLETLFENQQKSICQPIEFVQRLQCKEKMNLPCPQRVVPVPNIAWDKYGVSVTSTGSNSIESSHQLRSKLNKQTVLEEKDNVSVADSVENEGSAKNEDTMVVRGRVGDSSKPATFNQLWTIEEQRRLEELLVKYPPEEVEAKRWAKIAKDLGNRSTKQVASRVQKYFIKLAKAGLPVPGRTPNLQSYINRHRRKQHYFTRPLYPASTLLQSHVPPVYMDDDNDKCYDDLDHYSDEEEPASDDDSVPEHLRDTEEYRELMNMKKLKKEKLKLQQSGQSQHVGYCCDGCHSEPIIGIRWHCVDCPLEVSVDLCHSCAECGHVTDLHTPSHRMECIRYAEASTGYIDGDYTEFQPYAGDYNYLDPNYNPAKLPS